MTVFKENYALLCNTITDINELLRYFVAEKIITMDQHGEIEACATKSGKVSKLLLHISKLLEGGNTGGFYTMLKIMKTYGIDATQCLADHIITRININFANALPYKWTKGLMIFKNVQ